MTQAEIVERIRGSVSFTFARSGGPGGQNVNKVNTKAVARLPLDKLSFLTEEERLRAAARLVDRLSAEGEIMVTVQDTREQAKNREIALDRIAALLEAALRKPRKRKKTRPSAASRERRLSAKQHKARVKRLRGSSGGLDD